MRRSLVRTLRFSDDFARRLPDRSEYGRVRLAPYQGDVGLFGETVVIVETTLFRHRAFGQCGFHPALGRKVARALRRLHHGGPVEHGELEIGAGAAVEVPNSSADAVVVV